MQELDKIGMDITAIQEMTSLDNQVELAHVKYMKREI